MIHAACAGGITFFDTSDLYSQGESERLLGEALADRRHEVFIATKVGYVLPAQRKLAARLKPVLRPVLRALGVKRGSLSARVAGQLRQDFSPAYVIGAVDASLKRLRTDYLDLYQLHSPPHALLETGAFLEPLERLRRQGKIRQIGISCETVDDAAACLRHPAVSAVQLRLSLLDQGAIADVVPRAAHGGTAVIARECYAGGLLARSPDEATGSVEDGKSNDVGRRMRVYVDAAERSGRTLAESALHFVLGVAGVSVVLLGVRNEEQLRANLRSLEQAALSQAEFAKLRAAAA
jgi:aryl-alcohol dehydrogenase-like predicted oxidoreductase